MRRRPSFKLITSSLILIGLAVTAFAASRPTSVPQAATHLGSFVWTLPDNSWFGGFSALSLDAKGQNALVLNDRGQIASAQVQRNAKGIIDAVVVTQRDALRNQRGAVIKGDAHDSEGLAVDADGTIYVSFEQDPRVARYSAPDAKAAVLKRMSAFQDMPENKGLEALAIDHRGHLYTLPENTLNAAGHIPVWKWNGRKWREISALERRGWFMPVGADIGPDGRFYLLERAFMLFGFSTRLRRWDLDETGLHGEATLLKTGIGTHDNLEGLSIWRDDHNRLRATMISDDNFMSLQRTELVEYLLPN